MFLGLLLNGPPGWGSAVVFLLLIAVTQWVSFWAFRRHIAAQVLLGVMLCITIGYWLISSTIPMFWEHEESAQRDVYPITWRSDVAFLLLLAITQGISFWVFRRFRRAGTSTRESAVQKHHPRDDLSS